MLLTNLRTGPSAFTRATGWSVKPEGLCFGELCVPAPDALTADGSLDVERVADRLGMPLVHDESSGVWALGPSTLGGQTLASTIVPPLVLEDRNAKPFDLQTLRGRNTVLVSWASW